ncbi:MAG: hypothetical protein RJA32_1308, partial [Pseudomonadota bacterium]
LQNLDCFWRQHVRGLTGIHIFPKLIVKARHRALTLTNTTD